MYVCMYVCVYIYIYIIICVCLAIHIICVHAQPRVQDSARVMPDGRGCRGADTHICGPRDAFMGRTPGGVTSRVSSLKADGGGSTV